MKKLIFKREDPYFEYYYNVERIVEVCKAKNYEVSFNDARSAWEAYSEGMCAGWMGLPENDDELLSILKCYLDEEESETEE